MVDTVKKPKAPNAAPAKSKAKEINVLGLALWQELAAKQANVGPRERQLRWNAEKKEYLQLARRLLARLRRRGVDVSARG